MTKVPESLFIAGIENLRFSEDLGKGEIVGDLFRLTNNRKEIERLLTPAFVRSAGQLEANSLRHSNAVAYAVRDGPRERGEEAGVEHLNTNLVVLLLFLQSLWLVKDNAASFEMGYLEYPFRSRSAVVFRNFWGAGFFDSQGTRAETTFSREELREARRVFVKLREVIISTTSKSDAGRWAHGFYFMQAARGQADHGTKTANYCSALEALFATDAQELVHKLCERVACFLEADGKARVDLFRALKKAYGERSRVVHGQREVGRPKPRAREASTVCDQTLRRVLARMLLDRANHHLFFGKQKKEVFDDYFLTLVLGGSQVETPVADESK